MTGLSESLSVPRISTTSADRGRFFLTVVALRAFGWECGVTEIVGAGLSTQLRLVEGGGEVRISSRRASWWIYARSPVISSQPLGGAMTGKVCFTRLLQSCTSIILMKMQLFSVSSTMWPQLISVHIPSDMRKRLRWTMSAMPACASTVLFKTRWGHVKPSWTSTTVGSTSSYVNLWVIYLIRIIKTYPNPHIYKDCVLSLLQICQFFSVLPSLLLTQAMFCGPPLCKDGQNMRGMDMPSLVRCSGGDWCCGRLGFWWEDGAPGTRNGWECWTPCCVTCVFRDRRWGKRCW